jgi:hypothetical protein
MCVLGRRAQLPFQGRVCHVHWRALDASGCSHGGLCMHTCMCSHCTGVRFFGKFLGTHADYYVFETTLQSPPAEPEEQPGAQWSRILNGTQGRYLKWAWKTAQPWLTRH